MATARGSPAVRPPPRPPPMAASLRRLGVALRLGGGDRRVGDDRPGEEQECRSRTREQEHGRQPQRLPDEAAEQRADRLRSPGQEPVARVHATEERVGDDPLPERHRDHVPHHAAEARERERRADDPGVRRQAGDRRRRALMATATDSSVARPSRFSTRSTRNDPSEAADRQRRHQHAEPELVEAHRPRRHGVQHEDRERGRAREVHHADHQRERPQQPVREQVAEALADVGDRRSVGARVPRRP